MTKFPLYFTTTDNHESPNCHSYDWITAETEGQARLILREEHQYQIKNIYNETELKEEQT